MRHSPEILEISGGIVIVKIYFISVIREKAHTTKQQNKPQNMAFKGTYYS